MKKHVWHKGPPPHVGWWAASVWQNENMWRWWNGKYWSHASGVCETARAAATGAAKKAGNSSQIRWTDYYPENARVPRVAP